MRIIRAFLAVLAAAAVVCSCSRPASGSPAGPDGAEVQRRVLAEATGVNRLELARMAVTKMCVVDDFPPKGHGVTATLERVVDALKIGSRKAVYSYDTYLTASVDLSGLTPDDVTVDEEARTVSVRLPRPQVRVSGRDMTMRQEHYRVTGLRSSIGAAERADIKERMNEAVMAEINSDPQFCEKLVDTACRKARDFFEALLAPQGYRAIVTFANTDRL